MAIVVPCYNEQDVLPLTIARLIVELDTLKVNGLVAAASFLYFVDDGSSDLTWPILSAARLDNPSVCALKLSRNFGHQSALLAGLLQARTRCDVSISIDADLQQDAGAMATFLERHRDGAEIVFGVRKSRDTDSRFKRTSASFFYRLMGQMGAGVIPNHADYRLLSAKAMAALSEYSEPDVFLRAICMQLGYRSAIVEFDVSERAAGVSKYSLAKMVKLAVNGVTSFSVAPLRMITLIGLLVFGITLVMSAYILCAALFFGGVVPGWASTTLPIYFLGGVQILCVAIIGEYMAQILTGVKRRPRYLIDEELP
ncbi:glycosyltransferase family 2 protein [Pandoraea sp. PE-S2T-3]|uniref:glycosyltransferase family 2 protein n=1 Tax=Pandoraea sp. PE-S2T-3 TaxID=1986993 RepID=UPI001595D571|nr:glycosyltransferase family 2 protein [Pandoraea sp. PE-S2T-3]